MLHVSSMYLMPEDGQYDRHVACVNKTNKIWCDWRQNVCQFWYYETKCNSIPHMRISAKERKWDGMPNSRESTIYFKRLFVALKPE